MTPKARHRLATAPLPTTRHATTSYPWAGRLMMPESIAQKIRKYGSVALGSWDDVGYWASGGVETLALLEDPELADIAQEEG